VQQVTAAGAGLRSLAKAFHAAAPQHRAGAGRMGRSETLPDLTPELIPAPPNPVRVP